MGNWWDDLGDALGRFVEDRKRDYDELDRGLGGWLPGGYDAPPDAPMWGTTEWAKSRGINDADVPGASGVREAWTQAWEPTNPEGDYLSSGIRDKDVLGGASRVGELAMNLLQQPSRRLVEPLWGEAQYASPSEEKWRQHGKPDTDFWDIAGDVVTGGPIKNLAGTPLSSWQKGLSAVTGTPEQQEAGRQKFKELSTLSQLGSIPFDPTNFMPGLPISKGKRALEVAKAIKPIGKFSTAERLAGSVANVAGKSADEILAMSAPELRTPNLLSRTLGKVPVVGKPLAHLTDLTPQARVAEDLAATTDQMAGRLNNLVKSSEAVGDIDLKAVDAALQGMTDIGPEALATSKGAPSALIARQALTGATTSASKLWDDAVAATENLKALQAKRAAGQTVSADLIAQAEKAVKLAPANKMEAAARAGAELVDQAAKKLAVAHGLKVDKAGNVVTGKLQWLINQQKNVLGVALLGFNPNYPVQNFANNVVMTVLAGYNPFARPGSAQRKLLDEGFGVLSPARAKAGYGMAEMEKPKGPIMAAAVRAEKWASENIWTQGFARYITQAKNVLLPPDVLGPQMRAALANSDPRLAKWVEDIVRNGANSPAEAIKKINALPGFDASKALPDLVNMLSDEIKQDPGLLAFFNTSVFPWLDPKIKAAKSFEEVRAIVTEARGKLDKWAKMLEGAGEAKESILRFVDEYTAARSAAMKSGVEIRGAGGVASEIADVWDEARTAMGGLLDGLASSLKGKVPDGQIQKAVDAFTVWQNEAKAFQGAVQKIAAGPAGDDARQALGAAYTKKMRPIVTKANSEVYGLMKSVFDVEHMPAEKKALWGNYWKKAFNPVKDEESLQKTYGATLKGVTDPAQRQAITDAYHAKRQELWEAANKELEDMRRELFGDMEVRAPKAEAPLPTGTVAKPTAPVKMKWRKLTPDAPPERIAYVQGLEGRIVTDRATTVAEVASRTGLNIVDVGNATPRELAATLANLTGDTSGVPAGIKHVIITHGEGAGALWKARGGEMIQDIVNRQVPEGERAWVVACETGQNRNFATAQGREVVSGATRTSTGPLAGPARATGAAPNLYKEGAKDQISRFNKALDDMLAEVQNTLGTPVQGQVDPMLRKQIINAVQGLDSAFTDAKLAAMAKANVDRDFALLNYSHRYNFDHYLSLIMPFSFWQVATTKNMMARFLEQPGLPLAYAKYKKMLDESETDPGFPDRLRGMLRVSLPGAPGWLGDQFVDPLGRALPFRQMMYPIEAMKWAKESEEGLSPMLGVIGSPSPLITTPINLARKQGKDVGALLPLTRQAKAATAMYKEAGLPGAEKIPAGGLNIERDVLPIRQGLQAIDKTVPDIDQWEDYRIRRMLANMAQLGEVTAEEATAAMRAKSGPVYDKAVQKVGVEMGAGQLPIAAGAMTIKTYPKGEEELKAVKGELNALAMSEAAKALGRPPKDLTEAWDTVKAKGLAKKGTVISQWYKDHPAYTVRSLATTAEEDLPGKFASSAIWGALEGGAPSRFQKELPAEDQALLQRWYDSKDPKAFTPEELAQLERIAKTIQAKVETPEGRNIVDLGKQFGALIESEFANAKGPEGVTNKYAWLKNQGLTKKGSAIYQFYQDHPEYGSSTFVPYTSTAGAGKDPVLYAEITALIDREFKAAGGPASRAGDKYGWLKENNGGKVPTVISQWYKDHPGYSTSYTPYSSGGGSYRPSAGGQTISQTKAWGQFKILAPQLVKAVSAYFKKGGRPDPMLIQKLYEVWQRFRPGVAFEAWLRLLAESSGFVK